MATVTKILHPQLVLADSDKSKNVRVSVPVNVITPAVGDHLDISEVESVKKRQKDGESVTVLRANMISVSAKTGHLKSS